MPFFVLSAVRALAILTIFSVTVSGCSTHSWNRKLPQSPRLGVEKGIWRFPTPQAPIPPESDRTPETPASEQEPNRERSKQRVRMPKPYAATGSNGNVGART